MNDNRITDAIRQFFGGNFHQDWDIVAEEWTGVVDHYATRKIASELTSLARQMDLLRSSHNEETLAVLISRDASCAYNPRPLCYHGWLRQIADRLRQHAASIETGTSFQES